MTDLDEAPRRVAESVGGSRSWAGRPSHEPVSRQRWRFTRHLVPVAVTLVALGVAHGYRHRVGLDGLAYLSIAEAYASGDVGAGVNAYWSPLYSWAHVPFLVVGIAPLTASAVVGALTAGAAAVALGRFLRVAGISDLFAATTVVATAPLLVAFAHHGAFPDLLLAAVLLAALADLLSPRFGSDRATAARAGLLLGLAYLTKLYALPFALVMTPVATALHARSAGVGARDIVRPMVVAFGGLALVVIPWTLVLSISEGRPTVGDAGGYHLRLVSPGSTGSPIGRDGLHVPGREGAFSAWEDPSELAVEAEGWDGPGSATTDRLVDNVESNGRSLAEEVAGQGRLLVLAGGLATGALLVRGRPVPVALSGAATAFAVYSGGYLVTVVEDRYLWFLVLLCPLPVALLAERVRSGRRRAVAVGIVAVIGLTLVPPSVESIRTGWGSGRQLDTTTGAVADEALIEPGTRVASDGDWLRSAALCARVGCTYLGTPAGESPAERTADLVRAEVERYVAWSPDSETAPGLVLLAGPDDLDGLRVYGVPAGPVPDP